jgi:phosphoglycerate kinase
LPHDYQVAQGSIDGPLSYVDAHHIPPDGIGISIGPKTIELIQKIIGTSATIFYNGLMGFAEHPKTLEGTSAILIAMAASNATTIVAGGDSIALVDQLNLTGITHCITGGGSTLSYLSGQWLPGLEPFLKDGAKSN